MSAWALCFVRAWLLWPTLWCGWHDWQTRMEKSEWEGDPCSVPRLAQIDKDIVEELWLLRATRDGRCGIQGEPESQKIFSDSKENLLHNPAAGESEDLGHAFALSKAEFQTRLSFLPQQFRSGEKEKPKIEIATLMWIHSISKSIFDSANGRFLPMKSHGSLLLPPQMVLEESALEKKVYKPLGFTATLFPQTQKITVTKTKLNTDKEVLTQQRKGLNK